MGPTGDVLGANGTLLTNGATQGHYFAGATQGWNNTADDQLGGAGYTNEGGTGASMISYNKSVTANNTFTYNTFDPADADSFGTEDYSNRLSPHYMPVHHSGARVLPHVIVGGPFPEDQATVQLEEAKAWVELPNCPGDAAEPIILADDLSNASVATCKPGPAAAQ